MIIKVKVKYKKEVVEFYFDDLFFVLDFPRLFDAIVGVFSPTTLAEAPWALNDEHHKDIHFYLLKIHLFTFKYRY